MARGMVGSPLIQIIKRHVTTRHVTTRHVTTRHVTTQHDTTRHVATRHDTTRNDFSDLHNAKEGFFGAAARALPVNIVIQTVKVD